MVKFDFNMSLSYQNQLVYFKFALLHFTPTKHYFIQNQTRSKNFVFFQILVDRTLIVLHLYLLVT